MNNRVTYLLGAVLLALCLITSAETAAARTVWQDGVITRSPWIDRYTRIEINDDQYTLMPDIRVLRLDQGSSGGFLEKPSSVSNLRSGGMIRMRIQGRRIYEILILQ